MKCPAAAYGLILGVIYLYQLVDIFVCLLPPHIKGVPIRGIGVHPGGDADTVGAVTGRLAAVYGENGGNSGASLATR